jgi:hypothetical protein
VIARLFLSQFVNRGRKGERIKDQLILVVGMIV